MRTLRLIALTVLHVKGTGVAKAGATHVCLANHGGRYDADYELTRVTSTGDTTLRQTTQLQDLTSKTTV